MPESLRATRTGDTAGSIQITFANAINGDCITHTRPDATAARRLIAHFEPYNNTCITASTIVRVENGNTYLTPVDLTVNGAYRYCPCGGDESDCTR